jgi:uncharacterized membrane protein YraQ (UPF0718 family)
VLALRHGLLTLPEDLGGWILLGIAISGLLVAVIPDGWIESFIGSGKGGQFGVMLLMLVIGIPWYICATASTPLAAALMAKGLSPGAALVFLLVGPATNPATIGWVLRDLGKAALVCYLTGISVVALVAGLIANALIPARLLRLDVILDESAQTGPLAAIAAAVLLIVLVAGVVRHRMARNR